MGWPRFRSGDDPDAVCHRRVVGTDIGVLGVVVRHHPPCRAAGEGRECRSGAVNSSCGRLTCPRFSRPSDDHEGDGLPWPRAGTRLLGLGCRQKILACPDACSLCWLALSRACLRCCRCCSAHVSQRVWSGMGGAPHPTQSPRDLASFRFAWAIWRSSSFRSGVCALFRSYTCRCWSRSSGLMGALRLTGVVSRLGLGCFAARGVGGLFCGLGLLFRWVLTLLFLVLWSDRSMVYWKSCLSARCMPAKGDEPAFLRGIPRMT